MDEVKRGCIELYFDETQSYEYFSNSMMSNFSIPETQIEQLFILMRIGGKTTVFSNKSENDLKSISDILNKCNIKNSILIYDTKNWT